MKNTLLINFFTILFFALIYQPAFVLGDTIYFDVDGNVINEAQYVQTASERENNLRMKLRNGYNVKSNDWKDPIKLRKKRIEQWKTMSSYYNPDSLPKNIEKSSIKNK